MGEGKLSQTEPTKWDLAQKDQSSSLKPAPESRPQGWRFTSWLQGAIPSFRLCSSNLQAAKGKPRTRVETPSPSSGPPRNQTPPSPHPGRQAPPSPGSPLHRRRSSCVWKLRPGGRGELGPRLWGHCNHCVFAWAARSSC